MKWFNLPLLALLAAAVLLLGSAVEAQQRKLNPFAQTPQNEAPAAEEFFELCRSSNTESQQSCGSFVIGMIQVYSRIGESHEEHRIVCPPSEMDEEQARRMILGWADLNPDDAAKPIPMAVLAALTARYPCAKYLKSPQ